MAERKVCTARVEQQVYVLGSILSEKVIIEVFSNSDFISEFCLDTEQSEGYT